MGRFVYVTEPELAVHLVRLGRQEPFPPRQSVSWRTLCERRVDPSWLVGGITDEGPAVTCLGCRRLSKLSFP